MHFARQIHTNKWLDRKILAAHLTYIGRTMKHILYSCKVWILTQSLQATVLIVMGEIGRNDINSVLRRKKMLDYLWIKVTFSK